jgi:hypothetical protein
LPSLPLPQPADVAPVEEVSNTTNTVAYYDKNGGCCLKILVAMSVGLRDNDDNPVLSLDSAPWKDFPSKQIKPSKDEYIKEVICCYNKSNVGSAASAKLSPHPQSWSVPKIQEWLEEHPIDDAIDIEFVTATAASQKEVTEAAQKEDNKDNACLGASNWNSTACI